MYILLSIFIIVIGILPFVFTKRIIKYNNVLSICSRIIGVILIIAGLILLYFLLSGNLTLPLS